METRITLEKFCEDMRDIFKFHEEEDFTMKWLDEEGSKSRYNFSELRPQFAFTAAWINGRVYLSHQSCILMPFI